MDADHADVLSRYHVPRYRLSVEDYHRLGEAGILGEDDRVELLEGQLVNMSPIGPRHALAVDALARLLFAAVGEHAWLRVQNPITLSGGSEPQPDIVLARPLWRGHPASHPMPGDILLLVEVADSSFELDSGAKRELYARAGISEFWPVDLTADRVLVHRNPNGGRYASIAAVESGGILAVEALPGVAIPAAPLFS